MADKMSVLENISGMLALAGGLNWGTISFFNYNIVEKLLPQYAQWVYKAVGVASAYFIYRLYQRYWR